MQVLWKQSLLPLLSPVCVDLSNSSQTYDCLFGRTCKKFHFFLLSYNFFLHYLSSPFSHTLSFFAFTQGKSYIKVVVKSLLLKICSPPTQQISFSTFNSSVQFATQYVKFLFSPTQLVCFLFWHSQRLFMRISWHFVVYPGKYSEKYFYPGKYFISKIHCSRHTDVRVWQQ